MCTRKITLGYFGTETTLTVGGKYQAATIRSLSVNPHTIPKWQWIGTRTDIFRTEAFGSPAILSCREFYLYAIKKDGADLCTTKKVAHTCVPSI
jgi:hypothetical protein